MSGSRELMGAGISVPSTKERRRCERYPSAQDQVTVANGAVETLAVVLNASAFGMGLAMTRSNHCITEGQIVTIKGPSGPVSAVIRHVTTDGSDGAFYVGVEWCN